MPVIGFLNGQFPAQVVPDMAVFREGLKSTGYVEGENVAIAFRYADGERDKLPAITADLARSGVPVIVATDGTPVTLAVKAATATLRERHTHRPCPPSASTRT